MRIESTREVAQPNGVPVLAAEDMKRVMVRGTSIKDNALTSLDVDMYVASAACPVFSMAAARASRSFKLKPLSAAPRSAWSCAHSAGSNQLYDYC